MRESFIVDEKFHITSTVDFTVFVIGFVVVFSGNFVSLEFTTKTSTLHRFYIVHFTSTTIIVIYRQIANSSHRIHRVVPSVTQVVSLHQSSSTSAHAPITKIHRYIDGTVHWHRLHCTAYSFSLRHHRYKPTTHIIRANFHRIFHRILTLFVRRISSFFHHKLALFIRHEFSHCSSIMTTSHIENSEFTPNFYHFALFSTHSSVGAESTQTHSYSFTAVSTSCIHLCWNVILTHLFCIHTYSYYNHSNVFTHSYCINICINYVKNNKFSSV